jgi:hypothetical protein
LGLKAYALQPGLRRSEQRFFFSRQGRVSRVQPPGRSPPPYTGGNHEVVCVLIGLISRARRAVNEVELGASSGRLRRTGRRTPVRRTSRVRGTVLVGFRNVSGQLDYFPTVITAVMILSTHDSVIHDFANRNGSSRWWARCMKPLACSAVAARRPAGQMLTERREPASSTSDPIPATPTIVKDNCEAHGTRLRIRAWPGVVGKP